MSANIIFYSLFIKSDNQFFIPIYSIPESNDNSHLFVFNLSEVSNMTLAWCQIILFIGLR